MARLRGRRYIAEPKLDGQRAQLHIRQGRVVACYIRRGLDLLRHAGMAWLREITWPMVSAALDGEALEGDGHEGIQAVFAERDKPGGDMAFMAFDVLEFEGRRVLREPWRVRRKRLEELFAGTTLPRVGLVCHRHTGRMPSSGWPRAGWLPYPLCQRGRSSTVIST